MIQGNAFIGSSRTLSFIRWVVTFLLALSLIFVLYGLLARNPFYLVVTLIFITPAGLITLIMYRLEKRRQLQKKTILLADILEKAASSVEADPSNLTLFDILISTETIFVWKGIVAPFLIATVRFLDQATNMIISEESGRHRKWMKSRIASPIGELSYHTRAIASAIQENDSVTAFESIGSLFALALLMRKKNENAVEISYSNDEFVKDLQIISLLLKQQYFLRADDVLKNLIENIKNQRAPDPLLIRWQSIISYWLSIRFTIIETPVSPKYSSIWIGPSKLLSMQLDAIIRDYKENNYVGVAETIYESFDWRTRIPRVIVE